MVCSDRSPVGNRNVRIHTFSYVTRTKFLRRVDTFASENFEVFHILPGVSRKNAKKENQNYIIISAEEKVAGSCWCFWNSSKIMFKSYLITSDPQVTSEVGRGLSRLHKSSEVKSSIEADLGFINLPCDDHFFRLVAED